MICYIEISMLSTRFLINRVVVKNVSVLNIILSIALKFVEC